jgi:nucleoid-associated protein YgaU
MAMRDRDHRTETMEPYEPSDAAYDWGYDEEPGEHHPPTILWGRVAVLGAVILIAFLVGRLTAGGGGVDQEDFDRVRAERDDAQAEVTRLTGEVEALEAQQQTPPADEETPPPDEEAQQDTATDEPQSEAYVVQPGDSLRSIAEEFYGDVGLWTVIAEENNMTSTSVLQAGDEILIPPEPTDEE